jgi:hypothetical protein
MPYRLVRPEQQLTTGIHDGDTDSYDHDFAEQIDEEFSDRGRCACSGATCHNSGLNCWGVYKYCA